MSIKDLFQIIDDFTKTPNACFIIMIFMSGSAFKVFMHIVRQTIGYNKKSDGISISQFAGHTGVSNRQVQEAIKQLQELKVITVKSQTAKSGGKSYNRYSLNMKGINTLVQKLPKGTAKTANTKDNRQNTIEQKKREREGNILFSFSDNLKKRYIDEYINHLIVESEYIKSETAFKLKIKKKFNSEDEDQLQDFEEWYLSKECKKLKDKYEDTSIILNGNLVEVESIYPYFNTTGYNDSFKVYMNFVDDKEDIQGFESIGELEEFISSRAD